MSLVSDWYLCLKTMKTTHLTRQTSQVGFMVTFSWTTTPPHSIILAYTGIFILLAVSPHELTQF